MINIKIKNNFLKDVVIIASGTASAQLITILTTPFITRLFPPEVFGVLGSFMAITGVMLPLATLSYPIAIVLPKEEDNAKKIFQLSILIGTVISVIVLSIILLADSFIIARLNLQIIHDYLIFIPIAMFFSVFQQSAYQWLIRTRNYKLLAKVALYQSIMVNSSKILAGLFYPMASALIIITTLGYAVYSTLLINGIIKSSHETSDFLSYKALKVNNNHFYPIAKKYRDFPFFRTPQIFINALSQGLPILLLASFFGAGEAGMFTLARTIMGIPATLISKSVEDAIYPRLVKQQHDGLNISATLIKLTFSLAIFSFLPFLIIFLWGGEIFSFLFGQNWLRSGDYASWLSVWLFFGFINKPCVAAVSVIDEQKWLLYYEIFSTGTKIIALCIGIFVFKNDIQAIKIFSITGAFAYIYLITWVIWRSAKGN